MTKKRSTMTISPAPATRILIDAGATRVSEKASKDFAELLHNTALDIAKRAVLISRHSGRNTVMKSDIKLAVK